MVFSVFYRVKVRAMVRLSCDFQGLFFKDVRWHCQTLLKNLQYKINTSIISLNTLHWTLFFFWTASHHPIMIVPRAAWSDGVGDPVKVRVLDECGVSGYIWLISWSSILSIQTKIILCITGTEFNFVRAGFLYAASGNQCDQSDFI